MPKDLRSFLQDVRQLDPGQLIQVRREVNCKYEVMALPDLFEQKKKFPIVLYENVLNLRGEPGFRVLVNPHGDRGRFPLAFGLPPGESGMAPVRAYIRGLRNPVRPVRVDPAGAPVKEVVGLEGDADLRDLPIVTHHEEDGGPYLTQPVLSKDPEEGGYNLSYHRTMNLGKDENVMIVGSGHTSMNIRRFHGLGQPCPIAHVLGHHPALGWAATTRLAKDQSELALAGGLLREPVRMVPSETWGEEFLVPADAEIIVESEIYPEQMAQDGPFGEWTGYLGPGLKGVVAKVRAVTRRRDAILVTELMGQSGHYGLSALPNEAVYFQMAEQVCPHVTAIHFPRSGNGTATCYVSLSKRSPLLEGEERNVATHLSFGHVKLVVVVDEDVDVFEEEEVLRAIALRCQASVDVDIVRGHRGSLLDPSMVHPTTHDVMIIDATWKHSRRIPTRAKVPPEVLGKFRLEEYEGAGQEGRDRENG